MRYFDVIKYTILVFILIVTQYGFAETRIYSLRVDGLACPYCAYGIEKKLNKIKGVRFMDMNLDKGIVSVEAKEVQLDDAMLEQLFTDSGFSYRGKQSRVIAQ